MRKLIWGTLIVMLMFSVLGGACASGPVPAPAPAPAPAPTPMPTPVPTPTPVPMPTPVLTNSESDSRVAELEAKIRQLEAENQRLRSENEQLRTESEQLSSDLAKVNSVLRNLHSLATSSSYTNTISTLDDVQTKASELAYFAEGLPDLSPLPPGLTVTRINDAIQKARSLRDILKILPPPPPLAPSWWRDLDDMKTAFIDMTQWMENLQDLPGFLESAESLEELRSRVEGYLGHVQNTSSDAKDMLEKVRDAASP